MEESFEKASGVREVISGYSGGNLPNPTYKEVTYKNTGHFETVKIIYDQSKISFERLLNLYWKKIKLKTRIEIVSAFQIILAKLLEQVSLV